MLQYPIAHHRYGASLLAEEATLQPEFAHTLEFDSLPKRLRLRIEREIELADRILVYCAFHRETFLSSGVSAEKLIEIPLGVDLELFQPTPRSRDDTFRVTFVGQIGQRKGLSYLLDAFERARIPGKSELSLVGRPIGGDGIWRDRPGVRHQPHQPRSALPEVYGRSDVFVLPSLVEGFGLTALEAMACGKPVIVSDHTFGGDVVEDGVNGFVVPIRDPGAIAERLEVLSSDVAGRERMGRAARETAQSYSWEAFGDRVAQALAMPRVSESAPSIPRG
jgi:glycosyltransferase involved in cell wall biosynthesis